MAKTLAAFTYAFAALVIYVGVGLVVGGLVFGFEPLVSLSGSEISVGRSLSLIGGSVLAYYLPTMAVASIALLETAISFLGMGAPTDVPTWGETLAEGAQHPDRLRLVVMPGLLLLLTVGGSYLVADALRDAFDPRILRLRRAGDARPLAASSRP